MDKCILCQQDLYGFPTKTTEGLMCGDGMGCRRRALRLINKLRREHGNQVT